MLKHILFIFFLIVSQFSYSNSRTLTDSADISLLTSMPWDQEVYAMYGHTAIRVQDPKQYLDIVFNYGVFDFNDPGFLFKFVKGETNYMVVPIDYKYYESEYRLRGVKVVEQILNLPQTDKQKIWDALCINALPENRVYLYNFFFDNCATRPRDIIENNISGNIVYKSTPNNQTFRNLVHECVGADPLVQFGIDIVIGSTADRNATDREKMFLPIYMKDAFENALIKTNGGNSTPLILSEKEIIPNQLPDYKDIKLITPLVFGIILLIISIAIVCISGRKGKIISLTFDFFLFLIAGLAGCVVFFLMFFSIHPCVDSNWNLVWLNPIMLLIAFLSLVKMFSKYIYYYHFINFVLLALFILAWFLIPQQLNIAFIPYILALCVRSGANVIRYKRDNNDKKSIS